MASDKQIALEFPSFLLNNGREAWERSLNLYLNEALNISTNIALALFVCATLSAVIKAAIDVAGNPKSGSMPIIKVIASAALLGAVLTSYKPIMKGVIGIGENIDSQMGSTIGSHARKYSVLDNSSKSLDLSWYAKNTYTKLIISTAKIPPLNTDSMVESVEWDIEWAINFTRKLVDYLGTALIQILMRIVMLLVMVFFAGYCMLSVYAYYFVMVILLSINIICGPIYISMGATDNGQKVIFSWATVIIRLMAFFPFYKLILFMGLVFAHYVNGMDLFDMGANTKLGLGITLGNFVFGKIISLLLGVLPLLLVSSITTEIIQKGGMVAGSVASSRFVDSSAQAGSSGIMPAVSAARKVLETVIQGVATIATLGAGSLLMTIFKSGTSLSSQLGSGSAVKKGSEVETIKKS